MKFSIALSVFFAALALAAPLPQDGGAGGAVGECQVPPKIELADNQPGREANEKVFKVGPNPIAALEQQGVALNPSIIVKFFCNKLNDTCKDQAAQQKCLDFDATINGSKNGKVADDFNALFGQTTNFAALGDSGKPAPGGAQGGGAGGQGGGNGGGDGGNGGGNGGGDGGNGGGDGGNGGGDGGNGGGNGGGDGGGDGGNGGEPQDGGAGGAVGECQVPPKIELADNQPGREANEKVFKVGPNPIAALTQQGVALNPSIIVKFFCNKLNDTCKDQAAQQKCLAFDATINGSKNGKVADDFNALFGQTTNFAALGDSGKPAA